MNEVATRQNPGVCKENRRNEQEQEKLRVDLDAAEPGQERGDDADDDQQNRQGQRRPMDERATDGDGQEKEQAEFDEGHSRF